MEKCSIWKPKPNNKTLYTRLPPMEGTAERNNIQGDIRILLGKECEEEKMMRFLREIGMFEEI